MGFPLELFGERLAIKRDDRDAISSGGIVLPPDAQTRSMTGTVVAVGRGILKIDGTYTVMPLAVGDRVLFEQFRRMTEINVNGEVYHVSSLCDILGKVEADAVIKGGQ